MNKDFIENCKLLKSHFTKLTQAQTNTTQSKFDYESSSAAASINRAEQLLFLDRIDLLDKIDIEDIKQHALLKYANSFTDKHHAKHNHRLCERNNKFKWNDDIFCTSTLPYNKDKVIIFKDANSDDDDDEYVMKKEEVLQKYEKLEEASKIMARKKIDGTEVTVKNISPDKSKTDEFTGNHETTPPKCKNVPQKKANQNENGKLIEVKDFKSQEQKKVEFSEDVQEVTINVDDELPELKIIPQQQINIESILEVKKIIPDDEETTPDTNEINECLNETKKRSKSMKRDSHSSKINSFIENVEKFQKFKTEKSKSFVSVAESNKAAAAAAAAVAVAPKKNKSLLSIHDKLTSYAHRFKAQKDIIEMQKGKLMEQNKLIAQLKLNKIQIQAAESLENAQKELKKISPIQKHKAKLLEDVKKDECNEKNREINATLKLSKAPKILQHMEERAREREERRLLINERKRLLEEEKQRIIERAMQKKIEDEQIEKQKRLARLKEQREQLRQAEILKQEMKQRYIEINQIAHQHYKKKLKKGAIESFKMVIYRVRIKTEIGIRFYDNNIVIRYFKIWRENVAKFKDYRSFVANRFFKKYYLKQCMQAWKTIHYGIVQRNQVAIDRYEMSLQYNMFSAWLKYTRKCKIEFNINTKKAEQHYNRVLLYQYIHSWRSLPAILAIERVQMERKRKWRLRVAQILTDYDPLKSEAD